MLRAILQSWRSWKNAKAVAILAVLALTIGIGCATAVFTVVNSVLLNPMPYSHSQRWIALFGGSTLEPDRYSGLSISDLTDYQQRTHSFDVFGWYKLDGDFNLGSGGLFEHIAGVEVTPSLLNNVGISPSLGRLFQDSDGSQVALISGRLWERLGRDNAIVGKSITLDGRPYTVTGVVPPSFQVPIVSVANENLHNDIWIPINPPTNEGSRRGDSIYAAYARLKPGVTIPQARADATRVATDIAKENGRDSSSTATLFGLQEFVVKGIRPFLLLFLCAGGLLLLVTCANVAGLLVARSVHRTQEIAIRVALGARKSQLALQFILEGCFISIAAAVLGVLASVGLTHLILSLAAEYIPRSNETAIDGVVLVFVAGLACLTALLPALAPLRQAVRTQPTQVLSNGVRVSADLHSRKLSQILVVAEVGLAFLLLSAGGLLISEFENLQHMWPGFDRDHLLTFQINAPEFQFPLPKELLAYQNRLLAAIEGLPDVSGAAIANQLPLNGCCFTSAIYPEGETANPDFSQGISFNIVSPSYFKTMQIPLRRGQLLHALDNNDALASVVIDEATASRYWRGRDPIGLFGRFGGVSGERFQVIGVVGNVSNEGFGEPTRPEIYVVDALAPVRRMKVVVRSELPPASLIPAIRRSLQGLGGNLAIYDVSTMSEIANNSISLQRFSSVVVGFFALAALLMASVAIYGVTAYEVRERTVELGTRMALGATPRDLLNLVLGDSWRTAGYGILTGIPATAGATWLVMRFLHLHHISTLPYATSLLVVVCVATVASLSPAWRATQLSPMVAIRQELEPFWKPAWRSFEQLTHPNSSDDQVSPSATTLLSGFIEASRRADSFSEALSFALSDLREQLRSESAMLFENGSPSDGRFSRRAASPEVSVAGSIPSDGFLLGRLKFHTSITFAADEMDTVLRWASEQKPHYVPEIEYLKHIGMRFAVSLRTKDEIVGLLLLGAPLRRKLYSSADQDVIRACAQQLALMIENAGLTDRVVEQDKVRRDVALAAEVQGRLLPQRSFDNGFASVGAFILPARGVGGDCYDFIDLGEDGIGIALADVAGKGIAAALIMAVVQASLRIIASDRHVSPAELAAKMNDFLYRSTAAHSYATFFYAQFRSEKRQLLYVNAGHNPPYLLRRAGSHLTNRPEQTSIEELKTGGTVIGMFPAADYEEGIVQLHPGDVMLAFTDGVTEALSPNRDEFGEDGLKVLFSKVAHLPVAQIISCVSQELRSWIGDAPQHDDMTFIVAKINE